MKRLLLISLTALMPLMSVSELGAKQANLALSDAVVPVATIFLLWMVFQRRARLPLFGVCLISTALVILSSLSNLEESLAAKGVIGMWVEFAKLLLLWAYFYLVTNLVENREDFLLALKTWIIVSTAEAITGIAGAISYQQSGVENPFALMFRAQGTLGDSNLYGVYLASSFFLAVAYRGLQGPKAGWVVIPMFTYMAGVFYSASRGTTLFFLAALVLFLGLFSSWRMRLAAVAVVAVLGGGILLAPGKQELLESNVFTARLATMTVSLGSENAADRARLWRDALERFQGAPLVGIGRGNFRPVDEEDPRKTGQVHNTYLGILCEVGVLGFAAFMTFFARYPVALLPHSASLPSRAMLTALLTVALCGLTISVENFRGLWMLVGLMGSYRRLYAPAA